MINKTISHYKILEEIGSGGMGIVYKAEDTKLKRTVALKFLPPELLRDKEAKERFTQEAQAAASLNHTNICTIHEIDEHNGQTFIAMEYIEGVSLKDKIAERPLKLEQAFEIAIQIANGLQKAHEKGIIHRDIKPANILISSDEVAKIVDFGLAKLSGQTKLTKDGSTLGTVAYMSPEQTRGEEVDFRTDIWSLGAVMFELLTGELPFKGDYEQAMMYSILNEEPESLKQFRSDIPNNIEQVLVKSLAKDKFKRYQSMKEILQDLRTSPITIVTSTKPEKSIIVLPFVDMSPDSDQEYFSDGLTEEIITDLSQIHDLLVISRNSAMTFKDTKKKTKEIAKEVDVKYVLEGSVRKAGNNLRITAKLIDATIDAHLWAEKYKGTLNDIFDIQEKVSRAIVDALKMKLSSDEESKMAERPIDNVRAYDCYIRAKYDINQWSKEALDRAIYDLQNALDIIGDNPLLYACMGYAYFQYVNIGVGGEDHIDKSEEYVQKAFDLEPESSIGHLVMGAILHSFHGDQQQSIQHYKRALAIEPNDPDTMLYLGLVYLAVGKISDALQLADRISIIDPLNSYAPALSGCTNFLGGQFDSALNFFEKSIQLTPENPAFEFWQSLTLSSLKRFEEAFTLINKSAQTSPENGWTQMGIILKTALEKQEFEKLVFFNNDFRNWAKRDPWYCWMVADVYSLSNKKKEALDWLEHSVDRGWLNYPHLNQHDAFLENIRGEERFKKLMERIKYEWENFEV